MRAFTHPVPPISRYHGHHLSGRRPPIVPAERGRPSNCSPLGPRDTAHGARRYPAEGADVALDDMKPLAIEPSVGLSPFVPRTQYRRLPYVLGLPNNIKRLRFLGRPNPIYEVGRRTVESTVRRSESIAWHSASLPGTRAAATTVSSRPVQYGLADLISQHIIYRASDRPGSGPSMNSQQKAISG